MMLAPRYDDDALVGSVTCLPPTFVLRSLHSLQATRVISITRRVRLELPTLATSSGCLAWADEAEGLAATELPSDAELLNMLSVEGELLKTSFSEPGAVM